MGIIEFFGTGASGRQLSWCQELGDGKDMPRLLASCGQCPGARPGQNIIIDTWLLSGSPFLQPRLPRGATSLQKGTPALFPSSQKAMADAFPGSVNTEPIIYYVRESNPFQQAQVGAPASPHEPGSQQVSGGPPLGTDNCPSSVCAQQVPQTGFRCTQT